MAFSTSSAEVRFLRAKFCLGRENMALGFIPLILDLLVSKCAEHCSLIVIPHHMEKRISCKYISCWVIIWTDVLKVCWRQWLLLGFGSDVAWCCLHWRFRGCLWFARWSRAWHQVLFLWVLQNAIGLWCNDMLSCCSRFTRISVAATCVLKQVKLLLPTWIPARCFHECDGPWWWPGLGVHASNLRGCLSVSCSVPDFVFCLRQVTSMLWLSSPAVQWK